MKENQPQKKLKNLSVTTKLTFLQVLINFGLKKSFFFSDAARESLMLKEANQAVQPLAGRLISPLY